MRWHEKAVMSIGLAIGAVAAALAAPPTVTRSNGDAGSFYFSNLDFTTGTGTSGYVSFDESGPGPEAFVCYTLYEWTQWNVQITESGCGQIPATDVRGSAHGTLSIETDTSAPGFNRFEGNGGLIRVTLECRQPVPGFEVQEWSSGQSRRDYGLFVIKSAGSQFVSPASAAGVLFSAELPLSTNAQLYTSRQMTIEVQKKTP